MLSATHSCGLTFLQFSILQVLMKEKEGDSSQHNSQSVLLIGVANIIVRLSHTFHARVWLSCTKVSFFSQQHQRHHWVLFQFMPEWAIFVTSIAIWLWLLRLFQNYISIFFCKLSIDATGFQNERLKALKKHTTPARFSARLCLGVRWYCVQKNVSPIWIPWPLYIVNLLSTFHLPDLLCFD